VLVIVDALRYRPATIDLQAIASVNTYTEYVPVAAISDALRTADHNRRSTTAVVETHIIHT
jgi:hypothetical protein